MKLINGTKQEIGSRLDAVKQAVPEQIELYAVFAMLQKSYFDELIKAGFSKEEALHIVTVQGVLANGQPDNR